MKLSIVKYILIHTHAKSITHKGKTYTPIEWLNHLGYSYHRFYYHNGQVNEMTPLNEKALHAGVSEWKEDSNLNNCSIGKCIILNESTDWSSFVRENKLPSAFTNEMYASLSKDCAKVCRAHELVPKDAIILHRWVSGDHVRGEGKGKIDPGQGFDWQRLVSMTESELLRV